MCKRNNKQTLAILLVIIIVPLLALFFTWNYLLRSPEPVSISITIEEPKIIAEGFRGESSAIYLMNLDGSNRMRLFSGSMPDVSPDGKRLVYVATDKKHCLHMVWLETMRDVCLTSPVSVRDPRWSPCGKYVTFTSSHAGRHQVFVLTVDESVDVDDAPVMRRITDEPYGAMYPVFSHDSEWIYYNLPFRHRNLMRVHSRGIGESETVAETRSDWYSYATEHPEGDGIVFSGVRSRRLFYIDSPGARLQTLLSMPITADPILYPRWVRGSDTIIFSGQLERESTPQIYFVDITDLEPWRVTDPREGIRWRSPSVVIPGEYNNAE